MAGDWIPLRLDLPEDPAVIAISMATGLDEYAVVGKLHKLWSWANRHLITGDAESVTESWVDRYVHTAGFAAAMLKTGWLRTRSGHVQFPNFDRWNSESAKRRLVKTQQKRAERDGSTRRENVANLSPVAGDNAAPDRRPEKRREEKRDKEPPNPPRAGGRTEQPSPVEFPPELDTPDFRTAWGEWKAERARKKVRPYTPKGEAAQLDRLAPHGPTAAAAAIAESIAQGWQGLFPEKHTPPRASRGQSHDERILAMYAAAAAADGGQDEPARAIE
jgi:hypothetical protein